MKSRGYKTFKYKKFRFQFYYPEFNISKNDNYFVFKTVGRFVIEEKYFGFGFEILGFGLGFDYEN